jgi:hypothetical protein
MAEKTCCKCQRLLPTEAFYVCRHRNGKVGLQSRCISCDKARRRGRSPEEIRAHALESFESRFWSYVNKDGPVSRIPMTPCWEWTGYRHAGFGYGMISIVTQKPMLLAHRVSYEMSNGSIMAGMSVLHSCDYPPCVNPSHLSTGSQVDNNVDMRSKGRGSAKITAEQVAEIRKRLDSGETQVNIAKDYPISVAYVSDIKRGKARKVGT